MELLKILLYCLLGSIVIFTLLFPFLFSLILYKVILVRDKKEKWARVCSNEADVEQKTMYDIGMAWAKDNEEYFEDVEINSCGFKLKGKFINYGFDKTVIIVAGRTEGCHYCYYFAKPYKELGFNVLAIDNRSHGESEGKLNCVGLKEYADIINWAKFLHDEKHINHIFCHGVCIGSATCLYALANEECPEYLEGLIAEGMYINFADSFKEHMILQKRPLHPFFELTMMWMKVIGKVNPYYGPLDMVDKVKDKKILFIHSKIDEFSIPERSIKVYEKCQCYHEVKWFDKGLHSRIRINNTEEYDEVVSDFVRRNF